MEGNSFEQQIEKLKNEYYTQNNKSILFRNTQKQACANKLIQNLSIDSLCENAIYMNEIENLPRIYIHYKIFKSFAQESNYNHILSRLQSVVKECVFKYGVYQLHIDISSLTMTGAQRYRPFIHTFCTHFLCEGSSILCEGSSSKQDLQQIVIYNSPAIIPALKNLFSIFVPDDVKTNIIFA